MCIICELQDALPDDTPQRHEMLRHVTAISAMADQAYVHLRAIALDNPTVMERHHVELLKLSSLRTHIQSAHLFVSRLLTEEAASGIVGARMIAHVAAISTPHVARAVLTSEAKAEAMTDAGLAQRLGSSPRAVH